MNEPLLLIPFFVAIFLALNMGASGTAPAFAAAYGAKLIKKSSIPILFGLFVLLGAFLAGGKVSSTVGKEILSSEFLNLQTTSIILLAVSISLAFANWFKIPQSTSQATVFSVAACAIFYKSFEGNKLFVQIIPAWFILPLVSFAFMLLVGKFLFKEKAEDIEAQQKPRLPLVKLIVLVSSCYVAFAIGANNVGNIVGPLASMVKNQESFEAASLSFSLVTNIAVFIIAPYFGLGSAFLGSKVAKSTGRNIVRINPGEAVTIAILTASLLLFASVTEGIPSSLVQLNTGAIFGLAISKYGWRKVFNNHSNRVIWIVWFIAPLISFILTGLMLILARFIGLL
ncbi:MAG: inorganic phosphate transporter [Bacteroidetes bacterium]|nr:inorganic phosphate transporter [Bacteroidota bacterium]